MTAPRVSIIVPHLNQPEHLSRCLASLAAQSFDGNEAEIIVVDNGSSEMPEAICAARPDVRLALEAEPGPGPARNAGIALARAPLLAFIDADCLADRDWLKTIVDAFEADPAQHIVGGDVRIALADPPRMTMLEAYESIYAYRQRDYIERQGFSGTGNLAMRRQAFDAVGPFAGIAVAEDRDWGRRATARGFAIRYLPAMIVFHPARSTFAELYAKWDRHVAHDYAEEVRGIAGRLRWAVKALALALSPAWEIVRIARSDRVTGLRARFLALMALTRIRLYRARRMGQALLAPRAAARSAMWNRGESPGSVNHPHPGPPSSRGRE